MNSYYLLYLAVLSTAYCQIRLEELSSRRGAFYATFEDYLFSYTYPNRSQNELVQMEKRSRPKCEANPSTQLYQYFHKVPIQHWSCCMLGTLAGVKGFLCEVSFYADKIAFRNINRPHDSETRIFLQKYPKRGRRIMHHFSKCIRNADHSLAFNSCCQKENQQMEELCKYSITDP